MKNLVVRSFVLMVALYFSPLTTAGVITFDNRAEFEAYVNEYFVDDLEGIREGDVGPVGRPGFDLAYSWDFDYWGCADNFFCGSNPANPFTLDQTNDWIWAYYGGMFTFEQGITAFGFDFVNPESDSTNGPVVLNSLSSSLTANGSFFGIASATGDFLDTVQLDFPEGYLGLDNITMSTTSNGIQVSEPPAVVLFVLAVSGLFWFRKFYRKQQN